MEEWKECFAVEDWCWIVIMNYLYGREIVLILWYIKKQSLVIRSKKVKKGIMDVS